MKKLLLPLLIIIAAFCYGQKVDLDREGFEIVYTDLPTDPLNPEYKTYSVKLLASSVVQNIYSEEQVADALQIKGWKRISGTGHIIVKMNLDDLIITSSTVTERVSITKDKDGKETSRKYYYKPEARYTWNGKVNVDDYKGASVYNTTFGTGNMERSWAGKEYDTQKEAADYFNNNRNEIRGQLLRSSISSAIADVNVWLSNRYGYTPRKSYEMLWILDSKKHPEFQAQKDVWESFKATITTITAENFPAEAKAKLSEFIKYFDSVTEKYTGTEKPDIKLRYGAFYNKAKIYLILDLPEQAIKEADALIANRYDENDGRKFIKEAEQLQASFKKNNTITRYFKIDNSNAQPPQ